MTLIEHACKLTGYYPTPPELANTPEGKLEGGGFDAFYDELRGTFDPDYLAKHKLKTLQRHLDGTDPYVSVALDAKLRIPYLTQLFIPSFNLKYNRELVFRAVDHGDAFIGKGWSRADICCADKATSEDEFLNRAQGHLIVPMLWRARI